MIISDEATRALRALLGDRFSVGAAIVDQHSRGEGYAPSAPPDAVCFAETAEEVSAILKLCHRDRIPVVPWGAGTSLEGHVSALHGGICIDVGRMTAIRALNADDLDVTVEPGVTRVQLNTYLRDSGLFFPVDPGAEASLGGMAATRASGTNAVRYGTMKANVLALQVVLPNGDIIRTGSRARKSAAGYDLTSLFVGSEGTLGMITELTLRLYGVPETIASGVSHFADMASAIALVTTAVQFGIPLARVEYLDAETISAVNRFSKLALPERPTLFFELHGSAASVQDQIERLQELLAEYGGSEAGFSTNPGERERLWKARHDVHYAILATRPGGRVYGTDACVPISRLPECIGATRDDVADAPFFVSIVGHVGDGNFHLGMIIDAEDERELAVAEAIHSRLIERTLALGGTCSGEHGIGYKKLDFMRWEHGDAIETMGLIKRALDPRGIMNPGKLFTVDTARLEGL